MIKVPLKNVCKRNSFSKTLTILNDITKDPVIIEIGTLRGKYGGPGDGWSTLAWAWYCKNYGGTFYTVDLHQKCIDECKIYTEDYKEFINYVAMDGKLFLKDFKSDIHLLYLDGRADMEGMPVQYEQAKDKMAKKSLILLDDAPVNWEVEGKAALIIPKLLNDGWFIRYHDTAPGMNQMLFTNF